MVRLDASISVRGQLDDVVQQLQRVRMRIHSSGSDSKSYPLP
jgi:hypothetical protein